MLLASVHHLDFMAHDVSASQNLDSELRLGESPPDLSSALNQFQCQQYADWAGVLMAFCTRKMLLTNAICESLLALFALGCHLGMQAPLAY